MKRLLALSLAVLLMLSHGCLFDSDDDGDTEDTYSVSGRVVDLTMKGIENVTLTLSIMPTDDEDFTPRTVLSDSSGYYTFENVPDGGYYVTAERIGYRFTTRAFSADIDGESAEILTFTGTEFVPSEYAEFTITFISSWSEETHPLDFPGSPHFSPIAGALHNESAVFWEEGKLASAGIKQVAETGIVTTMNKEVREAIEDGTAYELLWGPPIQPSPGFSNFTVSAHRDFHTVTLITMIAPSPDWFTGVSGLDLFDDDDWRESVTVDLYLYDAGTDSGETYTAKNFPTPVPEEIRIIDDYAFAADGITVPIGTMTFTRTYDED
jgi:hypothetical protein